MRAYSRSRFEETTIYTWRLISQVCLLYAAGYTLSFLAGVSTVCMFLEVRYLRIVLWFQPLYFLYLKRTHYSVTH